MLVSAVLAAPAKEGESSKIVYASAVDITALTSSSIFSCFRNQNFRTAFVQIYQPSGGGMPNYYGPSNVQNAFNGKSRFISSLFNQAQALRKQTAKAIETSAVRDACDRNLQLE